jgi:prevent-host-death family protein
MAWQLKEAKNHFSEIVQLALNEGPQTITCHGKPSVVVVSVKHYHRECGRERLSSILRECPVKGWKIAHSGDLGRTIELDR